MITKIILKVVLVLILLFLCNWIFNHINPWIGIFSAIGLCLGTQYIFKKEINQILNN
jgi:hypothetical protein